MQVITGSSQGDLSDFQRQLVATSAWVKEPHRIDRHQHRRAQFLYCEVGSLQVKTGSRQWLVNANTAIYIPAGVGHEVAAPAGGIAYRSIYLEGDSCALSAAGGAFQLTPLLRALVNEAAQFAEDFTPQSPEARLMAVIQDQLSILSPALLPVLVPSDRRLNSICQQLIENPADDRTLDQWSRLVGASTRTLSRLFVRHTGVNFVEWRQRLRVNYAIRRMADGESLSSLSHALGYASTSALAIVFKRILGVTPSHYFRR